ncbi:DNA polymerase Y subunit UmuC family protein [Pareuzebyella sediminis]|uniref:hypothetical protein n=1 Tax=Pareuzebyella sediminis TaxID=2607998 RepID=UPI0011F060DB|nr:hypothetical protein [Pareuzebyella sediminis]
MNPENINIWCWLIPLIVGVIAAILGYLLGKGENKVLDYSAEVKLMRAKNAKLEADLDACNKKLTVPSSSDIASSLDKGQLNTLIPFDAGAAKAVFGKTILENDLKIVEGIGPKIEAMFKNDGIKTWKDLSEMPVAGCQAILNKGGDRFKVHDPSSWPMQAKMCYEGKWAELFRWQEEHNHGKL